MLSKCRYNSDSQTECPIFSIKSILKNTVVDKKHTAKYVFYKFKIKKIGGSYWNCNKLEL